jgi:tetratricopeptide (TPR) repeat protein
MYQNSVAFYNPIFTLMDLADCYRLLGLRTGASYEAIKASYRRLARQYHPDANPAEPDRAKEKFIQLTDAYKYLISVVPPTALPSQKAKPEPRRSPHQSTHQPDIRVTVTPTPAAKPAARPKSQAGKAPPVEFNPDLSFTDRQLKESSYEQLQQFLKGQRYPRAIALVEGLAQRMPHDTEIRQWQAITYQRFGRHLIGQKEGEKARVYLKKALRTDPHNKSLWYEVDRDFRRLEQVEIY